MNLVLLGPPGTGKGTIAKFIELKFGIVHVSTGDLLRGEVAGQTEIGKKITPIMNAGKLVDDGIVRGVLKAKLASLNGKPVILDGFPRNLTQGKLLVPLLKSLKAKVDLALEIDSSEEVIVRRLSARRQCTKCGRIYGLDVPSKVEGICDDCGSETALRSDDRPEVIRKRLALYNRITKPLSDFYAKENLLEKVDGNRPLQDIFMEVEAIIKRHGG